MKIRASITLPKLKRLFDDAVQGMIDENLLDEVYSEWLDYLTKFSNNLKRGYNPIAKQYQKDKELQNRLEKSIQSLNSKYTSNPKDKLITLNSAIQIYNFL